jgi:hypothetical protein
MYDAQTKALKERISSLEWECSMSRLRREIIGRESFAAGALLGSLISLALWLAVFAVVL